MVDDGTGISVVGSKAVANPMCTVIGASGLLRIYTIQGFTDETAPSPTTSAVASSLNGCRGTEKLTAYGTGVAGGSAVLYTDAGLFGQEWNPNTVVGNPVGFASVSAKSVFGREYGLIPRANSGGTFFMVNGVAPLPPYFGQGLAIMQRSEIFGARDGGVRAVVV